jgi:hypothetical protein
LTICPTAQAAPAERSEDRESAHVGPFSFKTVDLLPKMIYQIKCERQRNHKDT